MCPSMRGEGYEEWGSDVSTRVVEVRGRGCSVEGLRWDYREAVFDGGSDDQVGKD